MKKHSEPMPDNKNNTFQETLTSARRKLILDAATKVFAEKGFHSATIRDIAREAGIADGTIYIYFENKDALLLALLDRLNESEQRTQHFTGPANANFADFLRPYLEQRLARFQTEGFDLIRVAFAELLINPTLRDRYRQQVLEPTFTIASPFPANNSQLASRY